MTVWTETQKTLVLHCVDIGEKIKVGNRKVGKLNERRVAVHMTF